MKEYTIAEDASGQRLDRYLSKLFPNATKSFLQKMLRKKNIKLNGKKAEASQMIVNGDSVQVYFSDETIEKFSGKPESEPPKEKLASPYRIYFEKPVYEDENFLVINKPAGLLSQPDQSKAISAADLAGAYIQKTATFSPAPLTRLDRNTSGVLIFPKNYQSQKKAVEAIQAHHSEKFYLTLVHGKITKSGTLEDSLEKDEHNFVRSAESGKKALLDYEPLLISDDITLLKVRLHTGRTHQIRVQLAKMGHPILGDPKYGNRKKDLKIGYKENSQLLHAAAYKLFDENSNTLLDVSAPFPDIFNDPLKAAFSDSELKNLESTLHAWEPGIVED